MFVPVRVGRACIHGVATLLVVVHAFTPPMVSVETASQATAEDARQNLAALVQPHVHDVSADDTGFTGPAVDWIVANAEGAQFVLFGEQHGVDAIARFVADVYERLQPTGFDHLALEIGPWIATKLSTMPVDDVVARYPYSITFDGDAELHLLRTAQSLGNVGGAMSGAGAGGGRAGGPPDGRLVWGLDQLITAVHPFERLADIAPDGAAARRARGFFLKAAFKAGEYLRQGHYFDLGALRGAFRPAPGSEAELILDAAETSMRIFTLYRQRRIDESVEMREIYMTDLLSRHHDAAATPGQPLPRAVFKMGGAHVIEGIGPNGIVTLGDFAQKLAATHGSDALNIGIRAYNERLFGLPAELIEGRDGILIDTRALRPLLDPGTEDAEDSAAGNAQDPARSSASGADAGQARSRDLPAAFASLPEDLIADIRGFDALIVLDAPASAPENEIVAARAAWQRRALTDLAPLVVALAILLTGLIGPLVIVNRAVLRVAPPPPGAPTWAQLTAAFYALGAGALLVWQIAILLRNPLAEPIGFQPTSIAPLPRLLLIGGAGALLGFTIAAWRNGYWTVAARVHYTALALAAFALVYVTSTWNLLGIPG